MNMSQFAYPAIVFGLIISACASDPADPDSNALETAPSIAATKEPLKPYDPGGDITCRYEKPVGSHIMRKICTTVSDDERIQKETRDLLRSGRLPRTIVIRDNTRER